MNRLILFSGGVESTALLSLATPNDILVTIRDESPNGIPLTYEPEAVRTISEHYGFKVNYCSVKLPYDEGKPKFVYQLWLFHSIVSLWLAKDNSVKEVWYGLNKEEYSKVYKDFQNIKDSWPILHPSVELKHPLVHLSKEEQWNLIPGDVKPMVRNCLFNFNCRQCKKCLELKKLKGSVLSVLSLRSNLEND